MAKILICEDDRDILYFLRSQLEEAGHKIIEAPDGDTGFGEFVLGEVDLIITDLMMPGFSGAELVKTLNLIDDAPPVIVVTAYGDDQSTQMLHRDPSVVGILTKPWDRQQLLNLIAEHTR